MNRNAAGTLNQYPNLIELIGRHSELHGTAMWWQSAIGSDEQPPAIGSDEISDGDQLNPLPAAHENFLQDESDPTIGKSLSGHEVIGQDEVNVRIDRAVSRYEAIGQDEAADFQPDANSICNDEASTDGPAICSYETIGQDESGAN